MKNILIILALSISSLSFGQGNLQFNQVVKQTFSTTSTSTFIVGTITVPAGKVWKVESCGFVQQFVSGAEGVLGSSLNQVVLGSHAIYYLNNPGLVYLPLWLPTGTYQVSANTGVAGTKIISISAIEFNVVP
jgi:hypothetical protein